MGFPFRPSCMCHQRYCELFQVSATLVFEDGTKAVALDMYIRATSSLQTIHHLSRTGGDDGLHFFVGSPLTRFRRPVRTVANRLSQRFVMACIPSSIHLACQDDVVLSNVRDPTKCKRVRKAPGGESIRGTGRLDSFESMYIQGNPDEDNPFLKSCYIGFTRPLS